METKLTLFLVGGLRDGVAVCWVQCVCACKCVINIIEKKKEQKEKEKWKEKREKRKEKSEKKKKSGFGCFGICGRAFGSVCRIGFSEAKYLENQKS